MYTFVTDMLSNNNMFGGHICQNKIVSNIITEDVISAKICRPESLIQPKTRKILVT